MKQSIKQLISTVPPFVIFVVTVGAVVLPAALKLLSMLQKASA